MIAGTGYDVYLTKRLARQQKESCDVEKHAKLEQLRNGNHNPLNGKMLNLLFWNYEILHKDMEQMYIKKSCLLSCNCFFFF